MKISSRYILVFAVVLTLIGCDQTTKSFAKQKLQYTVPIEFFFGVVQLRYAENEGGFLGIGSSLPAEIRRTAAIVSAILVLIGFAGLLYFIRRVQTLRLLSFSILIAGSAGNLIDRLLHDGRVIDFLIVGTETVHTGIFNVADVLLTAGAVLLLHDYSMRQKE
jgi:signal peptidase II